MNLDTDSYKIQNPASAMPSLSALDDLQRVASQSLRKNIVQLKSGSYLAAGQNQFLSLWTRDFCHSVPGLLRLDEERVAYHHLNTLLSHVRKEDGLVPRVLDNHRVQVRVLWQALRHKIFLLPAFKLDDPLKPQYMDEHGSLAIDSNLLLLKAALHLRRHGSDPHWWESQEPQLKKVFAWYEGQFDRGLIRQGAFSDWQDSARRQGFCFFTQLLYFEVAKELEALGWVLPVDLEVYQKNIFEQFFDAKAGLFLSHLGSNLISLDGQLLALESPHFLTPSQKESLWQSLKTHSLAKLSEGCLGRCSFPNYPAKDLAFHIRLAGFKPYHGSMAWSWLMAWALKVALQMRDLAQIEQQLHLLQKLLLRDNEVYEVYDTEKAYEPFRSWAMTSEHPFAWGSAYLVEALGALQDFTKKAD